MKKSLILPVLLITGCQTSVPQVSSETARYETRVKYHIGYRYPEQIAKNIIAECNIGTPLSAAVQENAAKYKIRVNRVSKIAAGDKGNYIDLEIITASSRQKTTGPPVKRHSKSVSIEAKIYENGQMQHQVNGVRSTGGGVLGAMKTSCAVLERAVVALGKDVAVGLDKFLQRRGANKPGAAEAERKG